MGSQSSGFLLLLQLGFRTILRLIVKCVTGAIRGRFHNGVLGISNDGCDGVAEFGYSYFDRVVVLVIVLDMLLMSRRVWEVLI